MGVRILEGEYRDKKKGKEKGKKKMASRRYQKKVEVE